METMFYTQNVRPHKVYVEINSGEKIVEAAGYVSAQTRIENLISAGQRLIQFRKDQFDFPDGEIDEDYDDITRSPNFDLADVSQNEPRIEETIKKLQKQKKEAQNAKSSNSDSQVSSQNGSNSQSGNKGGQLASGEGQ